MERFPRYRIPIVLAALAVFFPDGSDACTFVRNLAPGESAAKLPRMGPLHEALSGADRVELENLSFDRGAGLKRLACTDAASVRSLVKSLDVEPYADRVINSCVCGGEWRLRFFAGERPLGEIFLRSRSFLRREGDGWLGDGELTEASRKAVEIWLTGVGAGDERLRRDALLAEVLTSEGVASLNALRADSGADPSAKRARRAAILAKLPGGDDPAGQALKLCRMLHARETEGRPSLGEADGEEFKEWLRGLSGEVWRDAFGRAAADDAALAGAWAVFASADGFEGPFEREENSRLLVACSAAKLRGSKADDLAGVMYRLFRDDSSAARALLRETASGRLHSPMICKGGNDGGTIRASVFACVPLAWSEDEKTMPALIAAQEKLHAGALSLNERLALGIAREMAGGGECVTRDHLALEAPLANYARLALEHRNTPGAVDMLVDAIDPANPRVACEELREEIEGALARMTGRAPVSAEVGPFPDDLAERRRRWRERFAKWWRAGRAS